MFENAKWIARDSREQILPAPLLRRRFTLDKPVAAATLHVCGLGLGEYWLNGQRIGDSVLCTPFTKYDSTVIYNTYDVTTLLSVGENVLGAMLGNGVYIFSFPRFDYFKPVWLHHPKLIAQLDITFADGTATQICSGRQWKTAESPIVYNETRRGETYDARRELPGWNAPGFDDSSWQDAFICRSPGGEIIPTDCPPIRVAQEYPGKLISDNLYDIGQNICGWAKIRVKGEAGQKIVLRYAEDLKPDGTPDFEKLNTIPGAFTHTDTYICKGDGVEEWSPRFAYHGFRYVEVENKPEYFELAGQFLHTDVPQWGSFSCSDPVLNQLHHMSRMSTLSNLMGQVSDCPTREQNGWTDDALMSAHQSILNFDMEALYSKWFRDIRDTQRPSGQISAIAPTAGFGYNWGSGPFSDSILILLPRLMAQYTGSTRLLEENWASMKKYMGFFATMTDDLIPDFGLGDWCPPPNVPLTPSALTDTAFYYLDNLAMADCARLMGEAAGGYEALAGEIRAAFRGRFMTDGVVNVRTQTAVAAALYAGLLDKAEIPAHVALLVQLLEEAGYTTTCGILGSKFIFDALSQNGRDDALYRMVTNPAYPGYGHWAAKGLTTLAENWQMSESLNHHMFSEVDHWFYKSLAGIDLRPEGLTVAPHFLKALTWVKASHRDITVEWDAEALRVTANRPFTLVLNGETTRHQPGSYCFPR